MDTKKAQTEEMIARLIARDIADKAQLEMAEMLRASGLEDEKGMLQGQTCHLLASFFLCTSIKILQMNKAPSRMIEALCDSCIVMAYEFAEIGSFRVEREH